ncbi:hypothetical protein ACIBQX_35725 [Nonomuraea sp. NPDC049714]|uniref:hypothetical protein n=1 Tax=Nonomuraea sp. NPDC049714 TaxID=3364357 RepID=UPI0037A577B7
MKRITMTATVFALAVLTVLQSVSAQVMPASSTTGRAGDASFGVPAAIRAEMLAQRPAAEVAHEIRMAVEKEGRTGLAGIALDGAALDVWWKGKLPDPIRRIIDSATDVKISVHGAAYSQNDLTKAAAALEADMRDNPQSSLHSIRYLVDGSGVTVETTAKEADIRATLVRLAGRLPVKVITSPEWRAHTWRQGDTMDFWGGGRIINKTAGSGCSAGFAVAGGAGMLTAGHCGQRGNEFTNGDLSVTFGWARNKHTAHDLLLIPTNAEGRIYFGDADAIKSVEMSKAVVGWDWAWPGELVCQSGATSGTVCGTRNTDTYAMSYCPSNIPGLCLSDMILGENIANVVASRPGDSGGPVFTFASGESGEPRVIAKGIVSGGSGKRLIYQDFGTAWRDFGLEPAIG